MPFLAWENPENGHKNGQKIVKNFNPSIYNVVRTGTNLPSMFLLAVLGSQGIVIMKMCSRPFLRLVD